GACTAQPSDRTVFKDGEQLGLEVRGQQPDLVEEERALMGGLEQARLGVVGIGEGAPFEAEQFGLEQSLGNGGAVDRDERPGLARSGFVDGPGEQALACPRLTEDQDGRKVACLCMPSEKLLDLRSDGYQPRTVTDQLVE